MARQANASYEGNGQRRSLDIDNALKRLSQLENQLKEISQEITEITEALTGKAAADHNHDGRYYTETEIDSKLKNYLQLAGGTVTGNLVLQKGFIVHSGSGTAGQAGYVGICRIKISGQYRNSPIWFALAQRGRVGGEVAVLFANDSGTDPALQRITMVGQLDEVRIVKAAAGTWDLYVKKSEAYDTIDVVNVSIPKYMQNNFAIEWTNKHSASSPGGTAAGVFWDDRYYTESEINTKLNGKANSSHTHDDRYYTETEMNTKLNGKANSSHTHDDRYYTETEVNNKNYIKSRGKVTALSGTALPTVAGISMVEAYNNGYPTAYGNVLSLNGSGKNELLMEWSGTSGAKANLYFRNKRDVSDASWSGWQKVLSDKDVEIPTNGNKVSLLPYSYYNNQQAAGMTLRIGNSSLGSWNGNTFWLCVDSSNRLSIGVQINSAKNPTWYIK